MYAVNEDGMFTCVESCEGTNCTNGSHTSHHKKYTDARKEVVQILMIRSQGFRDAAKHWRELSQGEFEKDFK